MYAAAASMMLVMAAAGEPPTFDRTGWVVTGTVGVADCIGAVCRGGGWSEHPRFDTVGNLFADADPQPGPQLGFEAGYRPVRFVDIVGGFSVVYQPIRGAADTRLFSIAYDLLAGANVFPIGTGRWDPHVGAAFGFSQLWVHQNRLDATVNVNRGLFRAVAGLDVFVSSHFTIGPRFEYHVPFGGKACFEMVFDDDHAEGCDPVSELGELGEGFPQRWSAGVAFKGRL